MEPIRGGRLTRPPETVAKLWANAPVQRTPQEWALRWVWNHPEVTLALSGMSNMQQVVENVAYAGHSQPHNLTKSDLALIGQVREAYRSLSPVLCTACRYCMPCPNGVDIPHIFDTAIRERLKENSVLITALSADNAWKSARRKYQYLNCWRKRMRFLHKRVNGIALRLCRT